MTWTLHPIADFGQYAAAWDRVNEAGRGMPFLHSSFIAHALRHFGSGEELIARHSAGGSDEAFGILRPKGSGAWETFQPAQLPLGAWVMLPRLDYPGLLEEALRDLPGMALLIGRHAAGPVSA